MTSLSELAYEKIKQKIVEGAYLPGDMLSENQLAKELGMSRTPIRSAISKLEEQGIFTSFKNKGILVKELARKDMLEMLELIYAMVVYTFETRNPDDLYVDTEALQHHLQIQKQAKADNDYTLYVIHSQLFIQTLIEAANNSAMVQLIAKNHETSYLVGVINYNLNPQQSHYSAVKVNEQLYEAVIHQQFDKIKSILINHHASVRLRSFNERRI
ncbi:GntR family transcriptional regulator [Gracilibacillus salinarum]|uniref:GntR family transcriptional regulator n=1 Tax=Gracilibacillus salinarum TaxID=2932255 RepID=A0ABY4GIN4_9BACI|nr:GntR family transcriptional regulator [Gracilibacillus salinarum]UOQ83347.1 GntR family transcriptional regulator [Gracilibacillus salinarum]